MNTVIYRAKFHENACEGILAALAKADSLDLDASEVIIVPDRYTLSMEKALLQRLPRGGAFNISVMTLKRIASESFEAGRYISRCGSVMLVKKCIKELADKLKCFGRSAAFKGFSESVYSEIARFKNSGISPQSLFLASEKTEGEISARLHDIALIYKKYEEMTAGKYTDSQGYLRLICDGAADSPFIKRSDFYFAGFDELTAAERECFKAIISSARSASFASIEDNFNDIAKLLESLNMEYSVVSMNERFRPLYNFIHDEIEKPSPNRYNGNSSGITLAVQGGRMQETEFAAQQIAALVREKGLRFKDICVVSSVMSEYLFPIDKVFKSYNIPYFISESEFLETQPLTKALICLMKCVTEHCPYAEAMAFIKSRFFHNDTAETDIFENYCLKYGIDRSRFLQPFTLFEEGAGFDEAKRLKIKDNFDTAEKIRQKFAKYYTQCDIAPMPCREMAESVKGVLDALDAEQTQARFSQMLTENGFSEEAAYNSQVYEKLTRLIDESAELIGDEIITLEDFCGMIESGSAAVKLSIIPVSCDAVNIGGADSARYQNPKALFILGAADGSFPPVQTASSLISSVEISQIPELSTAEGDPAEMLRREYAKIRRLLGYGADITFISYPSSDDNGGEIKPSEYFIKLKNMLKVPVKSGLTAQLKIPVRQVEQESPMLTLAKSLFFPSGATSISAIESFYSCPRAHFFKNGLYISEREQTKLRNLDRGNFLHSAVELYVRAYNKEKDCDALAEECYNAVAQSAEYRRFFVKSADSAMFERLKQELIRTCRALKFQIDSSDFVPSEFEAEFKRGGKFAPVEFEAAGKKLVLKGKIDRADVLERGNKKYIRVIDYKSNTPKYEEEDLYYGKKVQLFVYMKALRENGYTPAGAYYFPIHDKYCEEEENTYQLIGITVNEEEILLASGRTGEDRERIMLIKSGARGSTKSKNLRPRQTFEKLTDYSVKVCKNAAEEILSGFTGISPLDKSCDYCNFAKACSRFKPQNFKRKISKRDALKKIEDSANDN